MNSRHLSIYADALKRQEQEGTSFAKRSHPVSGSAPSIRRKRGRPRGSSRSRVRSIQGAKPPARPTKNEIEEFSFALRNDPSAKVQAVVPIGWQEELGEIASALGVEKLQLYRFILGEFLGKVRRKAA